MNDQQLLELAAKAADDGIVFYGECWRAQSGREWNPLLDDGDALRLAARLHLLIDLREDGVHTTILGDYGLNVDELHGEDAAGATRRAIVRAAAAIGKEM